MPLQKKSLRRNKKSKKTRKIRRQRGGAPLESMPQLCFGTVQFPLEDPLIQAIKIGYRHIDGAEAYELMHQNYIDYKKTLNDIFTQFKNGEIKDDAGNPIIVERKDLWITWKDDNIRKSKIEMTIKRLGCEYIDLFLIHHSCGTESDFEELKEAQKAGLIRFYGVSNCETIEDICRLKSKHNIFANQIQARPPGGSIETRGYMSPNFIQECNNLGVKIMLFSTTSGVSELEYTNKKNLLKNVLNSIEGFNKNMINQYYIQKFLGKSNVIMVSSVLGASLQPNYDSVTTFKTEGRLLSDAQMKQIEEALQKLTLAYM
jgi:diketogulonate reductase-like aldo/keto reductase